MKTIIAGTRSISSYPVVVAAIEEFQRRHGKITEVVSGKARGADSIGEEWAALQNPRIPVKGFAANWSLGPFAGPARNAKMGAYGEALCAIWDGESPGTFNMISKMHKLGKPFLVWRTDTNEFTDKMPERKKKPKNKKKAEAPDNQGVLF